MLLCLLFGYTITKYLCSGSSCLCCVCCLVTLLLNISVQEVVVCVVVFVVWLHYY